MEITKVILFAVLCLMSLFRLDSAQAGGMESGGGSAVYCDGPNTAELFDFYEAKTLRDIQLDLGPTTLDYMDKIKIVLARIANFDLARAGRYSLRLKSFLGEARFLSNITLPDIPDSNGLVFPGDCKLIQAAVQRTPEFPNDPFYLINKDLWDLMDNDSKAGLVLHEIIYREMREHRQKESSKARYYNSVVTSHLMKDWKATDYLKLLTLTELQPNFLWQDPATQIWWRRVEFMPLDSVESCEKFATPTDLRRAYPRFGAELKRLGLLEVRGFDLVFLGINSSHQELFELHENTIKLSDEGSYLDYTLCESTQNPFPL